MSEFSDRPFIAGSIIGARSFKVDSLGRLTGVSYTRTFTPGVNVATCANHDDSYRMADDLLTFMPMGYRMRKTAPSASVVSLRKHRVANSKCGCGFYAYFDGGTNTFHHPGQLQAVIEGFGTVTVGSRGFRAEKARLLALVAPRSIHSPGYLPGDDFAAKAYDRPWLIGPAVGVGMLGLIWTLQSATEGPRWVLSAAVPTLLLGLIFLYLVLRSVDAHYNKAERVGRGIALDLVRRNYPDVPVYRSLSAALRDHPLTPPPPPVEPSPENDPEFWTRQAVQS